MQMEIHVKLHSKTTGGLFENVKKKNVSTHFIQVS